MRKILRSQKGQGTIEYILVLMIVVVLILTVVTQFNDSFRGHAERFFDGYLACLLETGDLPGRGSECSMDDYSADGKAYIAGDPIGDWANNQPPSGYANSGSDSESAAGGGAQGDGAKGQGEESSGGSAGRNSGSETVANGGSGGDGSSSGVGSLRSERFGSRRSTPVGKADAKDKAAAGNADSMLNTTAIGTVSGDYYGSSGKKKIAIVGPGYFGEEEKAKRGEERPKAAQVAKDSEGEESLKPKKAVEPERKPAVAKVSEEVDFSFGNMLKWLLIIGIGIAIVVFFGGQILQASKSWEK